ncbi:DUF6516 family protein [Dolichospermum sp. UHCC 0259]|uniref:toxin-antitoxin system TumE family protein n=1 Tax=Dolichospermum sp. UHCC 0259 TaxID=2590010 RepID=UPI001447B0BF|nr:DUF6516 family protein [Dolichospermum sp. UHCC 0259]MTJ48582.1 hypothetical protein [Dolichospermum sp. UHCC 0259]
MIVQDYLTEIKTKLITSPIIDKITIVKERSLSDQGYFRARLNLTNGDFLEVVEFFKIKGDKFITETYRHQWMDSTQTQLKKRWDNVEHFPNLPNFPHHVHISEESNVYSSVCMNILEVIDLISQEIKYCDIK